MRKQQESYAKKLGRSSLSYSCRFHTNVMSQLQFHNSPFSYSFILLQRANSNFVIINFCYSFFSSRYAEICPYQMTVLSLSLFVSPLSKFYSISPIFTILGIHVMPLYLYSRIMISTIAHDHRPRNFSFLIISSSSNNNNNNNNNKSRTRFLRFECRSGLCEGVIN